MKHDGGPAFPQALEQSSPYHAGMSLRDYLAAKALPAIIAEDPNADTKAIAEWSYALAEALLVERAKE